jgi:VWFA-related protein
LRRDKAKVTILSLLLTVMVWSYSTVSWSQQKPGPPGTIRVQVTLVPVYVRVTDKDDQPVLDLIKNDFLVLENGMRQEIRHFSVEKLTAQSSTPDQKLLLRSVSPLELTPNTRRTFLILFGRGRIQKPFKSVDKIIEFVKNNLLPQDQAAVFAYNRASDFTNDHARVIEILEQYKKYSEKIEAELDMQMRGLAAIYGNRQIPKSSQSDIDKIFQTTALPSRRVLPGRITDAGQIDSDYQKVTSTMLNPNSASPFDKVITGAYTDLPFEEYVSTSSMTYLDIQNIYTAIEYLRYVEGEKHILFFTENGLFLPRLENDKSIAAMANDARVSVDTFQTGGVSPNMDMPRTGAGADASMGQSQLERSLTPASSRQGFNLGSTSYSFALMSLQNISQMTGGIASIHSNISNALDRLNKETMGEYLLGYYPSNTNFNGAYRRIMVRVNRPGVKVSSRHGYYARASLMPFDREAFITYSRIAAAGAYREEVKDLRFKATARQDTSSPDKPEIKIDLLIDPDKVPFQIVDGLHQGKLSVTTFFGDSRGRYLGDSWEILEMNLKEDTYQKAMKDGISFSYRVPMKAPDESLKVVIYNYQNDRVGSEMIRVK